MKRIALYGGAAALGIGLVYILAKKAAPSNGESWATTAGRTAATAVGDAAVGVVKGVGTVFGIPDTDVSKCQADLAAGRTLDASFSCSAGTFLGSVFSGTSIRTSEVNDARQIDRIMERQSAASPNLNAIFDYSTGEEIGMHDALGNRAY